MLSLNTSLPFGESRHLLAAAAWSLWAVVASLWVASLVPFYAKGMHLFSEVALQYAGEPHSGIPHAPTFEAVYGTSTLAGIAQSIVCFGPFVFSLIIGGVIWRLLTAWRTYSRPGIALRTAALLATLVLAGLSYRIANSFFTWGLG